MVSTLELCTFNSRFGLNDLSIVDAWFPRKKIHQWTWYSPDGKTRKALDHIM